MKLARKAKDATSTASLVSADRNKVKLKSLRLSKQESQFLKNDYTDSFQGVPRGTEISEVVKFSTDPINSDYVLHGNLWQRT